MIARAAGPLAAGVIAVWCFASGALAPLSAQSRTITSSWLADEISVDGSMTDWPSLVRVEDGPAVAAQNNDDTLLVVVASNDERVREQLATGLIVWIDASGRRGQTFGVRLEGLRPPSLTGAGATAAPDPLADTVLMKHDAFDLLGPARLQRRLIDDPESAGIQVATGVEHGMIAYELRIPLRESDTTPYAIGVAPGTRISIGLETPEPPRVRDRRRLADPMNTNPWIYDPWGYGNYFRPPPPPGGGDRAREPEPVKPMKLLWTTVQLATS
jgi:hypothetical protein